MNASFAKWAALLGVGLTAMTHVAVGATSSQTAPEATPPSLASAATSFPVVRAAGVTFDGAAAVPTYPLVNINSDFMFDAGPNTAPPTCALANQGTNYRWAVDLTTPAGIAYMKLVMQAYATGAQVMVFGAGTCNVVAQSEDILYMYINH
jgi:hypothetical protein